MPDDRGDVAGDADDRHDERQHDVGEQAPRHRDEQRLLDELPGRGLGGLRARRPAGAAAAASAGRPATRRRASAVGASTVVTSGDASGPCGGAPQAAHAGQARRRVRQTPSATAASATYSATSGPTRVSNTDGHDVVGAHVVAHHLGDGPGRGQLHALGDRGGGHVEGAAEDAGEGEHVVDLVRVVAAAGGDDRGEPVGLLGADLGIGVGHGEHDRVGRHLAEVGRGDQARARTRR